jgi:DNA-binding response OmpR family regulator
LVEDEFLVRLTLAEALVDAGFEVAEAETADAAARLLRGPDGFDMLLTDIQMPGGLDGLGLAREMRACHPGIPIVYMTGRPETMRAASLDAREVFIRKPYGSSEVLRVVRRLLDETGTKLVC